MSHHYRNNGGATFMGMILGAVATVGAYFLFKNRIVPEHKEKMKNWMRQMNDEVREKMREMKDSSQDGYHKLVDAVSEKYRQYKDVDSGDLERYIKRLKGRWRMMRTIDEEDEKV